MKIYVASSWQNEYQPSVVADLKQCGHDVYDFRNPKLGDREFHWSQIDPHWKTWTGRHFIEALTHRRAANGFESDLEAMRSADACVLVLPCNRSAHLEAGWFIGSGKPLFILLEPFAPTNDGGWQPELMYLLAGNPRSQIHDSMQGLLVSLRTPWEHSR